MTICNAQRYTSDAILSFRSRSLRRFWSRSDPSAIRPDRTARIERHLTLLDQATRPEDMDAVTFGSHPLTGDQRGRYAITVSRDWRITFAFMGHDAVDVDLEDYHGR